MTNTLEILDGACGTGKTEGIFEWMVNNPTKKYLYVTPFLTEVERACDKLHLIHFKVPIENKSVTKSESLLELLIHGNNITFTHCLFRQMTKYHLDAIKKHGYTLVIDEECDLIEPYNNGYTSGDIKFLLNKKCIEIDHADLGRINWVSKDENDLQNDKYAKFRNMCRMQILYAAKSNDNCLTVHLPIGLIEAAQRVVLLSYRFEHSIMHHFVKMKGLNVTKFNEVIIQDFDKQEIRSLIEIIDFKNEKHYIGKNKLSMSWYENANQTELEDLGRIIRGICKNQKANKNDVMWTAPSNYTINATRKKMKVHSYGAEDDKKNKGCFVACNSKATNEYCDKNLLIHAFNRFPNQILMIYLRDYGFEINSDEFALSEMIQWVWRSRIRINEKIKICFISRRMRDIFEKWLTNDSI